MTHLSQLGPRARIDLHMHSTLSDGAFSPEEVLRRCAASGLDCIALTDHDLAGPIAPGPHQIDGRTLTVVAGAEISGTHEDREFHLLVYFPGAIPERFRAFCRQQCVLRAARYDEARDNLGIEGIPPSDSAALSGERALTRLHLARAMVELGHATHLGQAFSRWLGESHGNVPRIPLSMLEAIAEARACGGLTSWAHPSVADAEAHLPAFAAAGLHGIEALRPTVKSRDRGRLRKLAARHGLFLTGGSDWHGWAGAKVGLFSLSPGELSDFADALAA